MDELEFEHELIARANRGDNEAGLEILRSLTHHIDTERFDSPLFPYLAEALFAFTQHCIPLERALGLEDESNSKGGAPRKYDDLELAAVDAYLRYHAEFRAEAAIAFIHANIGADRRQIQRLRKKYTLNNLAPRILLNCCGSMRKYLADVLPQ